MSPDPASPTRFWPRALAYLLLAVAISNALLSEPVERGLLAPLRACTAGVAAALLGAIGVQASASADLIRLDSGALRIVDACTGLDVAALLALAMLVFPAPWRARARGIALGVGAVLALNFARVVTLAYGSARHPDCFEFAHAYAWPALISLAVLAILLAWTSRASPR